MTSPSADVVRISSPADLVNAVPHLLGFVPSESVVVICLHGPRRRFGLTLRYDLPAEERDHDIAADLARRAAHERPAIVAIVVFTSEPTDRRALVAALEDRLDLPVLDSLLVRDGRWASYHCDDPQCCPTGGTALDRRSPTATALAAAYALRGRAVAPDRATIARSLAPPNGQVAAVMRLVIKQLEEALARTKPAGRRPRARRFVTGLVARYADPRARLGDREVARFVVLSHDIAIRDDILLTGADPDRRERLRRILGDVVLRAVPPYDAPVCTLLAWFAYADGDGVVATLALERAAASDPDYSLARLLGEAVDGQVPPGVLHEVMRATDSATDVGSSRSRPC